MTISGKQLREALLLAREMFHESVDQWTQKHLLVWRVSR